MGEGLCHWQVSAYGHPHSQWHRLGPFPALSVLLHVSEHECLTTSGLRTILSVRWFFSPLDLKVGGRLGQGLHETMWIRADACFLWLSHPSFAFEMAVPWTPLRFLVFQIPIFSLKHFHLCLAYSCHPLGVSEGNLSSESLVWVLPSCYTSPLLSRCLFIVFPWIALELLEDRDCAFISPAVSLVLAFNGCSVNIFRRKEAC